MPLEVIGFDIGHGETAVARIALTPLAKPQILEIDGEKCQVTAVGRLADGQIVVGEQVFRDPRVSEIRLGFKKRPPATLEAGEAMLQFVGEYDRRLIATGQILGRGESYYFVGCPSGWTEGELVEYEKLLGRELSQVKVVRESRAALLQAREDGKIEPDLIAGTIVVIDFGSSTTDVTIIVGGIQLRGIDFGVELGAYVIDRAILEHAVSVATNRLEIEEIFRTRSDVQTDCERQCRLTKEQYFQGESSYHEFGRNFFISLDDSNVVMKFRMDGELMSAILASPRAEFGGQSWIGSLTGLLEQVWRELSALGQVPGVLVVTGGPSRMSFVRALCGKYFPEPATRTVWCTPPEETVALGLARWGNVYFQTGKFIESVGAICTESVPKLVSARTEKIKLRLAEEVSAGVMADVVEPLLLQWREGYPLTLDGLNGQLNSRIGDWLNSSAGQAAIHRSYAEPLSEIHAEVNLLTGDICQKYGIPHSSLRLSMEVDVDGRALGVSVGSPFEGVTGVATGISVAVLLVLTAIAKGALLTATLATGPPGWLVGALLAAWVALFGTFWLHEAVSGWDFPVPVRRFFLSDSRRRQIVVDSSSKLRAELVSKIGEAEMAKIKLAIAEQVSVQLRSRAEEVRWIISDSG